MTAVEVAGLYMFCSLDGESKYIFEVLEVDKENKEFKAKDIYNRGSRWNEMPGAWYMTFVEWNAYNENEISKITKETNPEYFL